MPPDQQPSVCISHLGDRRLGSDTARTVVWVRGEHDIATRMYLCAAIAQASRRGDVDIVVDLSGVTFMDASTIGALVLARHGLRARSCSLSVRAPSPRARQVLELCDLAGMIDESPLHLPPPAAPALGSWVEVPTELRGAVAARPSPDEGVTNPPPFDEPVRVAAQPGEVPEASIDQSRSP